ncbi:MAG: cupin domain-containing protein [Synergistaceae bacterium]|nr:cupin domain-containing protein [Synergistaceae bacterium]
MKEKEGVVFSIAKDNELIPGCTVSKSVFDTDDFGINYFSMAGGTDISAESYSYHKIIFNTRGELIIFYANGQEWKLSAMESFITPVNFPVGMKTDAGTVYLEIRLKEGIKMNPIVKNGEVFKISELVPYQEGRIVNMDLVNDPKMKFVVMAFDEGTGLSEHAAPGEALIFALDGQGIIGYEGKEHVIKAGENFKFAKNGKHFVKANEKFKMALLLTLE